MLRQMMDMLGLQPGGLTEEDMLRLRAMQAGQPIPPQQPIAPPPNPLDPMSIMAHMATTTTQPPTMVAGLLMPKMSLGDAMSSADRAAYYQATGERISGGGEPETVAVAKPAVQEAPRKYIDESKERAYLRQREEERLRYEEEQAAARSRKRTYYGD